MKKYIKSIRALFAVFIGLSLSTATLASEGAKTIIRGKATVTKGAALLYLGTQGYNIQAQTRFTDGNFLLEADMKRPELLIFFTTDPTLGNFNIYLKPGDDISVAVKDKKIVLSGKGSEINQFYLDMSLQYGFNSPNHSNKIAYEGRVKAINTSKIAGVKHDRKILLGLTQGEYLKAIFGNYIRSKITPPQEPIAKIQIDNWDLKFVSDLTAYYGWTELLNEYLFAKIEAGKLPIRNSNTWVADFASAIGDQTLREAYIVELFKLLRAEQELTTIHDLAKQALPLVKDKANVAKINSILQEGKQDTIFQNCPPGKDFSTLIFQRPDGTTVPMSHYKGKVIFIDLWATWCAPCVAEMPFLKRVEHGMEGEDIVFLSVSVDKKDAGWLKFLEKNNSTGEQLWMPNGTENSFFKQIAGYGIPRFVILDKQGKMLNPKCYLRPSNPVLSTYLKELVKK